MTRMVKTKLFEPKSQREYSLPVVRNPTDTTIPAEKWCDVDTIVNVCGTLTLTGSVSPVGALVVNWETGRNGNLNASFHLNEAAKPGRPKLAATLPVWPQSHHITRRPSCNGTDSPRSGDSFNYKFLGNQSEKQRARGRVAVPLRLQNFQAGAADAL